MSEYTPCGDCNSHATERSDGGISWPDRAVGICGDCLRKALHIVAPDPSTIPKRRAPLPPEDELKVLQKELIASRADSVKLSNEVAEMRRDMAQILAALSRQVPPPR